MYLKIFSCTYKIFVFKQYLIVREVAEVVSVEVGRDGNWPFKVCECLLSYTSLFRTALDDLIFIK